MEYAKQVYKEINKEIKEINKVSGRSPPEKKFKAGAITATVWTNNSEKGKYSTVNLDRVYKDGESWKTTGSLRMNDLPKAVLVLSKAYEYLVTKSPERMDKEDVASAAIEELM